MCCVVVCVVFVVGVCVLLFEGGGCLKAWELVVSTASVCPSGLRGYVQVVMFSNSWVQIPQLTFSNAEAVVVQCAGCHLFTTANTHLKDTIPYNQPAHTPSDRQTHTKSNRLTRTTTWYHTHIHTPYPPMDFRSCLTRCSVTLCAGQCPCHLLCVV